MQADVEGSAAALPFQECVQSRFLLLGCGGQLDLLPFDLAEEIVAVMNFNAMRKMPAIDNAIVAKTQLTAICRGIENHFQDGELTARGIEHEIRLRHVSSSQKHVRLSLNPRKRSRAVVN